MSAERRRQVVSAQGRPTLSSALSLAAFATMSAVATSFFSLASASLSPRSAFRPASAASTLSASSPTLASQRESLPGAENQRYPERREGDDGNFTCCDPELALGVSPGCLFGTELALHVTHFGLGEGVRGWSLGVGV